MYTNYIFNDIHFELDKNMRGNMKVLRVDLNILTEQIVGCIISESF